ncbi:protein-L-isoaspartate O-methyltransferase family protein [Alkalilimnicola sp. S0819]|uniref:protein-L-isoaspartate O-methyltransferase family protein n=1 Tax=Alkalilimnicola sp. S0819 TaxID=2613922 RepID=UPI00126164E4|nr:protein-L-isoaspartate O-methyltransferase [Alkalilimnicola sp. S0819]KAB7627340.1 protein-L-isoaspartate O-methyltransferase [Alkalilimnicola sp. S0819]MPQ16057.1 methyltransferase domain-containing protein [Alkalilimnicola sp. S0819]
MTELDFDRARFYMVEQQIRTWEVLDPRVLDVFSEQARHLFVPAAYKNLAYSDVQIPLGEGEVMMEPKQEARILQALNPQPHETALEIGTGSGWFAACLAQLAGEVTSVDIRPAFTRQAEATLKARGIEGVQLLNADAAQGWDNGQQYDVIAVTGALPELHQGFHRALTPGGRLLLLVGETPIQEALLITRVGEDQWATESLFETWVPTLTNAHRTLAFAL